MCLPDAASGTDVDEDVTAAAGNARDTASETSFLTASWIAAINDEYVTVGAGADPEDPAPAPLEATVAAPVDVTTDVVEEDEAMSFDSPFELHFV